MAQKLYAANIRGGLVFLVKQDNFWTLPGGVKNDSDNDHSFLEKIVGAVKPAFFGSIEHIGDNSYKFSFYICRNLKEKKDNEGNIINKGQWFDYNHLPKNLSFDSRESLQYIAKYGGL